MDIDLTNKLLNKPELNFGNKNILNELIILYETIEVDEDNVFQFNLLFHNINLILQKIDSNENIEEPFDKLKYYLSIITKLYIS